MRVTDLRYTPGLIPYLKLLARKENGLPLFFLTPGPPVMVSRGGEAALMLRTYGDVMFAYRNEPVEGIRPLSRRALAAPGKDPHPLEYALWFMDPPEHTNLRAEVKEPFLAAHIAQWESLIYRSALAEIDRIRNRGASFCLTTEFGQPFALSVISTIIGAPGQVPFFFEHLGRLARDERLQTYPPEDGLVAVLDKVIDDHAQLSQAHGAFGTLLSIYPPGEREGRNILRGYLASLLFAGTDTVAMTLGNVVIGLQRWGRWDEAVSAAQRDDRKLLSALIDEAFRLDVAFPASAARAVVPVRLPNGKLVQPGTILLSWISAANRDERFDNPNQFVPGRKEQHLGFGLGYHHCLGAPLAKLELVIAMQALLTQFPGLQIAGEPEYEVGRVKRMRLMCRHTA